MSAQTHIDATFAISTTAQNADLDDGSTDGFPSLTYTPVPGVVDMDNTGLQQNMVSQNTWDTDVTQKGKGFKTANDPTITFSRPLTPSAGLTAMLEAAESGNNYAFKITYTDGLVEYNRGLVGGPEETKGDGESFRNVIFVLGLNQRSFLVDESTT